MPRGPVTGSTYPPATVGGLVLVPGIRPTWSGGGTGTPSSSRVRCSVQAYSVYPDSRSSRAKISRSVRFPAASHCTAPNTCSWAFSRWAVSPWTAAATSWAMAMNGTGIGTSTTGNDRSSAAARKSRVSGGTNRPSDRARQATPASSSRSR